MLPFFAYWRELFQLLRGARENPVISHQAPWRRTGITFFFLVVQILISVILTAIHTYFIVRDRMSGTPIGSLNNEYMIISLLLLAAICAVVFPINLLAWSTRWRDPDRLSELVLTNLTPRQLAFGSIFWPTIVSLIIPLTFWLNMAIVYGLRCYDLWHTPNPNPGGYNWNHYEMRDLIMLLVVSLSFIPIIGAAITKIWFYLLRFRWLILVIGPLYALFVLLLAIFSGIAANEMGDFGNNEFPIVGIAGVWLFAIAAVRTCGRLAPSLFIRTIDMQPYIRQSVIANEALRFYRKELRVPVRKALREHVPIPWRQSIVAVLVAFLFVVGVLVVEATFFIPQEELKIKYADFGLSDLLYNIETLMAIVSLASLLLYLQIRRRMRLVSGASIESILRIFLPLSLYIIAYSALGGIPGLYHQANSGIPLMREFATLLYFLLATAIVLIVFHGAIAMALGFRYGATVGFLLLVVYCFAVLHGSLNPEWGSYYQGDFWEFRPGGNFREALTALIAVILLYNYVTFWQKIYARRLLDTPIGSPAPFLKDEA